MFLKILLISSPIMIALLVYYSQLFQLKIYILFSLLFEKIFVKFYYVWNLFAGVVIFVIYIVRYMLYKRYAKYVNSTVDLIERKSGIHEPLTFDLLPEVENIEIEPEIKNSEEYLGAFLSSIKLFGYIERPVFLELASCLLEKQLKSNEILFDDEVRDKSLYIVLEGSIRICLRKSFGGRIKKIDIFSHQSIQDGMVLTEIGPGGMVSSLFNILSTLSENEEDLDDSKKETRDLSACDRTTSFKTTLTGDKLAHPKEGYIYAYATMDTHLISIPQTAFYNISKKFPKAAAHMIQVILTRLQKVTFITLSRYLDLIEELISIEKSIYELNYDAEWSRIWSTYDTNTVDEYMHQPHQSETVVISEEMKALKRSVLTSICKLIELNVEKLKSSSPMLKEVDKITTGNLSFNHCKTSSVAASYSNFDLFSNNDSGFTRVELNKLEDPVVEDESFFDSISSKIEIFNLEENQILVEQHKHYLGVFFVLEGEVDLFIEVPQKQPVLFETTKHENDSNVNKYSILKCTRGSLIGYLPSIIGNVSFFHAKSTKPCIIGLLKKDYITRLIDGYPEILVTLAKRLVKHVSPLVRYIDIALEWKTIPPGNKIALQGESSENVYFIIHGRLRAIKEKVSGTSKAEFSGIVAEYGPGDSIGEMEILTGVKRETTLHTIRETEVIIMSKYLFNVLGMIFPETILQISRNIVLKAYDSFSKNLKVPIQINSMGKINSQLKNIAIVPVNGEVPLNLFSEKLFEHLEHYSKPLMLNNDIITSVLGKHIFSSIGTLKLQNWLFQQEEMYDKILYVIHSPSSNWTVASIKQADIILFVAVAESEVLISDFEKTVLSIRSTARKELILLYPEKYSAKKTRKWLQPRQWILNCHHIQMTFLFDMARIFEVNRHFSLINLLKSQFRKYYDGETETSFSITQPNSKHLSDFGRLARRLNDCQIGLALSGGGARGIAHIGIIKALEEFGIPIDMIGGTSMGAFVGAIYAQYGPLGLVGRIKRFCHKMNSKWRELLDLTYPIVAWFTGHQFNRAVWTVFGETEIEDLWINYFCTSTNVTHSKLEIHTTGYLWRYVRASMSLSGWLPPICDKGNILIDGGYLNNLPMDIIRDIGARYVLAVDVGKEEEKRPVKFGDTLNGWWLLFLKLFRIPSGVPSLSEIQYRLAYVSCDKKLEELKTTLDDAYYLRPPVEHIDTLDFKRVDEIIDIGYLYMKDWLKNADNIEFLKQYLEMDVTTAKRKRRISL